MNLQRISLSTVILSTLLALGACGGGAGDSAQAQANAITAKINAGLNALSTSIGLTSNAVTGVFYTNYLDMGFSKTNLTDVLAANSAASGTTPELSLFPLAQVTNPVISSCDANNVCTLNATLVNSDADTTSVDFSTKVIIVDGAIYLYGDQSSTTSI